MRVAGGGVTFVLLPESGQPGIFVETLILCGLFFPVCV
jgi:hypothetical protein